MVQAKDLESLKLKSLPELLKLLGILAGFYPKWHDYYNYVEKLDYDQASCDFRDLAKVLIIEVLEDCLWEIFVEGEVIYACKVESPKAGDSHSGA